MIKTSFIQCVYKHVITLSGVHSRGGEGGPSTPLEELLLPLGSKFHIFLQSYYEMMKGVQHVHVLYFK